MKLTFILFLSTFLCIVTHAQNVGIGTTTPNASAALDITSATKGFLPPRMNTAARDLIPSPVAGLTIYNITSQALEFWNGTSWISTAPAAPTTHIIGESFGGGKVFYITPNALHGLIAETQDQAVTTWYSANDAISFSSNHSVAGQNYTDWRLPTKNELNLLYIQRTVVGGFANGSYWSSSEVDDVNAWYQAFYSGSQNVGSKSFTFTVRAVRSF